MNHTSQHTMKISFLTLFVILLLSSGAQAKIMYGVSVAGNRDYPGGDYAHYTAYNLDECVRSCADDGRCIAFAFDKYSRTCWLKDRIYEPVYAPGIKSGRKLPTARPTPPPPPPPPQPAPRPHSRAMDILPETDLPGGDYQRTPAANTEMCSNLCMRDHRCKAFTYNRGNQLCWLKSYRPRAKARRGAVSGIKF